MAVNFRRLSRACILIAIAALAPAASAIGQSANEPASTYDLPVASTPQVQRAIGPLAVAAAREFEKEAERLRLIAIEDARVTRLIEAAAAKLAPGKFVWRPERATRGPVEIVASLAAQRVFVFRSGRLIAVSTVSTGRPGNETPTGTFPILQKKREHFSNLYDGAPMPNMQRLTWDGVALHAGAIPGRPASHGCVRLPAEFSRLLYGVTSIGSVVHIVRDAPPAAGTALAMVVPGGGWGRARAR
jgi:lipoprotein-anchoring transpeptidase ErfK/SrfK